MASIKLDMTNAWADGPRLFGEYLHDLTAGLKVTFDVTQLDNTHEGPTLEFTGRPADLGVLIRRYESDPGLRKELHDQIKYVDPMPGSGVS